MESGEKRTQRDYTLAFKLSIVVHSSMASRSIRLLLWPLVFWHLGGM